MNVTAEILYYLFSRSYPLTAENIAAPGEPINAIRRYSANEPADETALFVMTADELKSLGDTEKSFRHLFVITEKGKPVSKSVLKKQNRNLAVTDVFYTTYELQNVLLQIFHQLLYQENELLLATLDPHRAEEVFTFGPNWFPWEYSIVDIDMHLIYRTENLHKVLGGEKVDKIPTDSIGSLILSKEFHDAAKKKGVFYQSMTFNNLTAFARNILPDGQYAGRVVMFLDEPLTKAPKGAEELYEFYTDCIRESLRRTGRLSTRPQNDPLRLLCRSLYNREQITPHGIRDVLSRTGWKIDHAFSVTTFRFLPDSVWDAQLETTLPYLADELENEWPFSCAVNTGQEIQFLLNLTLAGFGDDLDKLHQQFAYFVREHLCLAGVSSIFHDFSLLSDARTCAAAALRIGQEKHPHLWYYLFDDYRLDYIKETLTNAASPGFLSHPAINVLSSYDEMHHTELSKTLKAYLDHDRNMTTAADAIFVHRTTFCRRMDHVRNLTGLNLNDPKTLLLLELSYQLEEM